MNPVALGNAVVAAVLCQSPFSAGFGFGAEVTLMTSPDTKTESTTIVAKTSMSGMSLEIGQKC